MATPYEGYLGILDKGQASSSEFAFKQAQFDQMQKNAANLELERQRVNVDRDRQLDISKQQADTAEGNLEVNQAEQLNRDAAERRTANKQKKADLTERWGKFTFDSISRLNQMAKNATEEENFEKAQMYNNMAKDLATRSTKGEDFDYINMISTVYGAENIGPVLNDLGAGTSLLEDWKNPEKKGFANFAFNPETGMATTGVQTERGIHPVTAGGQNFADGGEAIEGGEFPINSLNRLLNFHEASYGSPEADLIVQTSGGERNKNLTLKDLFKEGRLDLLQMDRDEKEDLALSPNSTFEAMSDNIAKDLYGELMVEPEIEPVDATFKITPSGIQADSGIDLSGENAAAVIKDSFRGEFARKRVYSTGPRGLRQALSAAYSIVKNNPATYQNFVDDQKAPFGLSVEDQKDLTQNHIKVLRHQSLHIANASALLSLDDMVYTGRKESLGGVFTNKPKPDIGEMMAGLDSGRYKENTLINGERYSKAQAEEVKKFYEGNRKALGFKLATDVKYRQQFIDMGPMKFALSYADDPELFKRAGITKKIQTKAKVDLAQMKTYLKKNHDITIPTGADLTPESLEEFNNKVNNLEGLSQELKNKWDTTLAAILNLSIDRNTDTIDTTWLGTDNYNNYMAAMALSVTPDVDNNMRQHFFNLATYGKSTGVLAQDATEIDNFTQLATSRAALQVSASAKAKNDKVKFDGQLTEMGNLAETTLGYLLGEEEWITSGSGYKTRPVQPNAAKYEIALQEMFEIRKDVLNYYGPFSSQYRRVTERLYSTVSAQAEKFAKDNKTEGWFEFWYGPNASPRASDAIADVRMTVKDGDKVVELTKMSQLYNEDNNLDVSKLKSMSVVQGKLDIGRGGSFYEFVQKEGMESGLVILDMMGLKNDVKP